VVVWATSQEATVGKWVASPGTWGDPVGVGVISVAARKYKAGDQPPKTANDKAGWLGISLDESSKGPTIMTVWPKSPAQKAGLKVKDLVLKVAGHKVIDSESLINRVGKYKPGDVITLNVKRGKEDLEIKATLEKRPKMFLGNPQERMGTALSNRRGGFPTILQHDSGLRPEDCGGPLVDLDGKAVGINISRAGRTETYAIPAEDVQALFNDLKSGKLAPKTDDRDDEPAPKKSK
jgi:serine protease Do